MRQAQTELSIHTRGRALHDLTPGVRRWVAGSGIRTGLLTLFIRYTSASLTVQENADPDVLLDLMDAFGRLAPEGGYRHDAEGPDDMPAHIKTALSDTSLGVPVMDGRPCLGSWQAIYLFEHRHLPHQRSVVCHLIGD